MIAPARVFFSDTFTFRRSISLRTIAVVLLLGLGILGLAGIAILWSATQHVFVDHKAIAGTLVGFAAIAAIVLLVLGVNWLWHYATDYSESIRIDEEGVKCGRQQWSWRELKAVGAVPMRGGYGIMIWSLRHRPHGMGRGLRVDHPLSVERAGRLVDELRTFFLERGLSVECGIGGRR